MFDTNEIPDIKKLSGSIVEMIEEVDKSDRDLDKLKMEFVEKYVDVPVSIIKLLTQTRDIKIQTDNISCLLELLDDLQKVKDSTMTFDECKIKFSDVVANRFIYPQFGGKDAFEKYIKEKNNLS
jgi:hypothetical protein